MVRARDGDFVRSLLALIVVAGGGALLAAVWFVPAGHDPAILISALIGVITSVLGWYFGSRGVEKARDEANHELALRIQMESVARDAVVSASRLRRNLKAATRLAGILQPDSETTKKFYGLAAEMGGDEREKGGI